MKKIYPIQLFLFLLMFLAVSLPVKAEDVEVCEDAVLSLVCPPDAYATCDDELWDLSSFGQAQYNSGSGWQTAPPPTVTYNLNMCNTGTIVRTWAVEDPYWNWHTCSQTIYVTGGYGSFDEYDIDWPEDITLTGCNPNTSPYSFPYGQDQPHWNNVECSMVGVSYTDYLYTVNASCKKILRVWTVIDWCQEGYDYYGNPLGEWTYTQKIKIINSEVPDVWCPDDIYVESHNCENAVVNVPPLEINNTACGEPFTVTNNSPYAYNNGANLSGVYPIGTTWVTFTVHYGCNSKRTCKVKVHVTDDNAPTPICYGSLTVALMGIDSDDDGVNDQGMVEIWASDLNKGSYPGCNPYGYLKFSFSPDPHDNVRVLTCEHIGVNYLDMWVTNSSGGQAYCTTKVIVQNNAANIINCEPDPNDDDDPWPDDDDDDDDNDDNGEYDGLYDISGKVHTQTNEPVGGVHINLTEGVNDTTFVVNYIDTTEVINLDSTLLENGEWDYTLTIDTIYTTEIDTILSSLDIWDYTNAAGRYHFDSTAVDSQLYTITATLDSLFFPELYTNFDINSQDLKFLMDYLTGDESFRNGGDRLAADIDQNGIIDFEDLKRLYKYLTGQIDVLTPTPWVVVGTEYLNADGTVEDVDALNVIYRTVNGAHVTNGHFTLIEVGDIVPTTGGAGLVSDDAYDLDALSEVIAQSENLSELVQRRTDARNALSVNTYPNPFIRSFQIELDNINISETIVVELYKADGSLLSKSVYKSLDSKDIITLDLENAYKGLVIYKITNADKTYSGRILSL